MHLPGLGGNQEGVESFRFDHTRILQAEMYPKERCGSLGYAYPVQNTCPTIVRNKRFSSSQETLSSLGSVCQCGEKHADGALLLLLHTKARQETLGCQLDKLEM